MLKILLLFLVPLNVFAMAPGLNISLAGDLVYDQGLNDSSAANEKFTMRGAEVMFSAPIDHNFDGVLSVASHDEGGERNVELHELYVSSSKFFPGFNIKAGQFFLGVGRLNRVHRHDWYFTTAPKVHEEFFADEGVFDTGVEVSKLLPLPFYVNLSVGVTGGHHWGHAHQDEGKPQTPTHYGRLSTFKSFNSVDGMEVGVNYLGRKNFQGTLMSLAGADFVAKWKRGKVLKYLFQSEAWYKKEDNSVDLFNEFFGSYLYAQYGKSFEHSFGSRIDTFKELSRKNALGQDINNITYQFSLNHTYTSSEFMKFRSTISHEFERVEGITASKDTKAEFQIVFILGSHPAHIF